MAWVENILKAGWVIGVAIILAAPWSAAAQGQPPPVRVTIITQADPALVERVEAVSTLANGSLGRSTFAAVRRRAAQDSEAMTQVLHAQGHYAGAVDASVARAPGGGLVVTYTIDAGPLFTITRHAIVYADDDPAADASDPRPRSPEEVGVTPTSSPSGEALTAMEDSVISQFRTRGYPTTRRVDRFVEANFTTAEAVAVLVLNTGPRARFGPVRWTGLERTKPDHLAPLAAWTPGAPMNADSLRAFRDALGETGLFTVVQVDPGAPDQDGLAPVLVTVRERKPRTVGGGASFATNLGATATAFWEHRNLRGRAEQVRVSAAIGQSERGVEVRGRKPFPGPKLTVFAGAEIVQEENDAFDVDRVNAAAGIEKRFGQRLRARLGGEVEIAETTDAFGVQRSTLIAAPLEVAWENVDDPLDPRRGARIAVGTTPVTGDADSGFSFIQTETTLVNHVPINEDRAVVVSSWARVGATLGADLTDIPATRRLYAGGGGSVRGYGFQRIGPLSEDGLPTGGRSVVEGGVEVRARVSGAWSAAVFVETGLVSPEETPDFAFDDALASAGVGVRYATPVGPVRFDVAFPFDRRGGVDDPFQVYISLGQSF